MILIFKTTLHTKKQVKGIRPLLSAIREIKSWTVDLQDCDRVLRMEVAEISPRDIENLLFDEGFECRELD